MIPLTHFALLALVGYRVTQLVVHDSITAMARLWVMEWSDRRPTSAVRRALDTLVTCIYCAGFWLSGLVLATYLLATDTWSQAPVAVHGLEWFGLAGAAALLNRVDGILDRDTA